MLKINMFLFYLVAPFLALFLISSNFVDDSKPLNIEVQSLNSEIATLHEETNNLAKKISEIGMVIEKHEEVFNNQNQKLTNLSELSASQKELSNDMYEQKILEMLGPAVEAHISERTEIKIFKLNELGYRGYIAKVKLFDPKAFKVGLAKNTLGELETTSSAAKRENAILAINGGGFYTETRNTKKYAQLIGNTVIDGKLVEPFNGYPGDLFFAGINKKGEVVGNVPQSESDISKLNPSQGVSFMPVLLKNGKKVDVPKKWKKTRHPRTIIGKYANDDLIMIVVDGRQGKWSYGVSLERLQDKLLELGVKEAYNLDGGGSTAMYYNGKILNRPSDGRQRPVANNILIFP
ncbi:phosphodiester glycosidase family protein [Tepidibacter hydrothermalis]|uniref:Phosphodiester glycosidase family protein n=1 Tax=Tepidibacter hydrothermalis TaxID=3036126 RepID=A0ABY8EG10_9FIRM|nr:phosphodiester glycosidase family protein [Tepidibacter hydrothermalis]WFD11882.1 phosphodiester glycosidase family protein [Tepidibacter hydrothermalis]